MEQVKQASVVGWREPQKSKEDLPVVQAASNRDGKLHTEASNNYIKDNANQISHCQRRELQRKKENENEP